MSNELSTKVYKLDFKDLIDNATNKVYWAKRWTLFEYNGLKIEFTLHSIEIADNKLLKREFPLFFLFSLVDGSLVYE